MKNMEHQIISPEAGLKDVMSALNNSVHKILFCCRKDSTLLGTITDGDVRRAFLLHENENLCADIICNKKPITCNKENIDQVKKIAYKQKILFIPLLEDGKLIEILNVDRFIDTDFPPVVLMAGGLGKRLGEITKSTPKPLVKLQKNIAIIDIILMNLMQQGMTELFVTLNFEWKKIKDYLLKKYSKDIKINFVVEEKKMGTAGSLFYLKNKLPEHFILMNADIVTSLDFKALIKFHTKNKNLISVAANKTSYEISKGVIKYSGSVIQSITEKPQKHYTYNAGIYVINKKCIENIKEDFLDMPDLITQFISTKKSWNFPFVRILERFRIA